MLVTVISYFSCIVFAQARFSEASKAVIVWKRVNPYSAEIQLFKIIQTDINWLSGIGWGVVNKI